MKKLIAVIVWSALFASTMQAAITYVDANPDPADGTVNVTVQGVAPGTLTGEPPAPNFMLNLAGEADGDGVWQERPRTTVNGTGVLVSVAGTDDNDDGNGILWTSTPEIPAGTYFVYLFFWVNSNGAGVWDCQAAIGGLTTMTGMTTYTKDNATNLVGKTQLDGFDLPTTLVKDDGTQDLFGVAIGMVTLTSPGSITVSTAGIERAGEDRTWFDGIGYVSAPCGSIPDVTVAGPIVPGTASVTVNGIASDAQSVKVFVNGALVGSAAGNPPNTPASMTFNVSPLALNDRISARQTLNGVEKCGPVPETTVALPPPLPYITYVDADPHTTNDPAPDGNTTVNGTLVDFTAETGNATTGTAQDANNDGKWSNRTGFANGGDVWETMDETITPSPLVTTLTLTPGTYNLYGLLWSTGGVWDAGIRVGSTGSYVYFARGNVLTSSATGSEFVNSVLTREADRTLFIAPLGQFTVSGSIEIYVLAPDRGVSDERSWYDGVGYELVSAPTPLQASDGFGDGDRNNNGVLDDPDGSGGGIVDNAADVGLEWLRVLASQAPPAPPASHTLRVAHDATGLGDDNALHVTVAEPQAIQVASFAPTVLADAGDFIRLTFKIRLTGVVNFGDVFRFGLFHDNATAPSLDQPTPGVLDDDFGYVVAMATGVDFGESHLAGNVAGGNLGSLLGEDELLTPDETFDEVINDTVPHTLSLTITRGITGGALISVSIDGVSATSALDSTLPMLAFNEVALGTTPVQAISYIIDDVLIESGETPDLCATIPPVTVESVIPAGATTVTVSGILPAAESVNVYSGTTLIGSAAGSPPNTPASLAVTLTTPPALNDLISARQVVAGEESCRTAPTVTAGDCAAVPAVWLLEGVSPGSTTVSVAGVSATSTAVQVYANGTTLIGTGGGGTSPLTVTVTPLVAGDRIMAIQTINSVDGCMPASGPQVLSGRIIYFDAVPHTTNDPVPDGNTTVNGALVNTGAGGNVTTSNTQQGGTQPTDGLWHMRVNQGSNPSHILNGTGVWETDVPGVEETAPLVTTVTLPPGTYSLYGLFWINNVGRWDVDFRVGNTGEFTRFDRDNGTPASATGSEFANAVITRDGTNQFLFIAPLGQHEITSGTVSIYVNGSPDAFATEDRTWFDGIGIGCGEPFADTDHDRDVDQDDFGVLQRCLLSSASSVECACLDLLKDGTVDTGDFDAFDACNSGPMIPASPSCDGN